MTNKEELINALEVLSNHCTSKHKICPDCELRLTCCKHIETSMFSMCLTAQLELSEVKDD